MKMKRTRKERMRAELAKVSAAWARLHAAQERACLLREQMTDEEWDAFCKEEGHVGLGGYAPNIFRLFSDLGA